jgi:hypothetical protein
MIIIDSMLSAQKVQWALRNVKDVDVSIPKVQNWLKQKEIQHIYNIYRKRSGCQANIGSMLCRTNEIYNSIKFVADVLRVVSMPRCWLFVLGLDGGGSR